MNVECPRCGLLSGHRYPCTDDVPVCLRLTPEERKAAWKGHKLTKQGSGFCAKVTKVEEAATRKLRRELEAAEAAKREARFERLRELRGRK